MINCRTSTSLFILFIITKWGLNFEHLGKQLLEVFQKKKVFWKIAAAIFKYFLKIAVKFPVNLRSTYLRNTCNKVETKMNWKWTSSQVFFNGFDYIFQNTYFSEHFSLAASECTYLSLFADQWRLYNVIHHSPLNQEKFQIINQNKEARCQLGGENPHEQQGMVGILNVTKSLGWVQT